MNARPPRSEPTNRTFDYFLSHASLSLMGFNHRSEFWSRLVPMLCETQDAVLRGVLALSKGFEVGCCGGGVGGLGREREENLVCLRQYNKAIRALCERGVEGKRKRMGRAGMGSTFSQQEEFRDHQERRQITDLQYIITLTCCVLFICLENIIGNYDIALQHLENGLKLLREWMLLAVRGVESERAVLVDVFRRLDMQATAFLNSRKPEMVISNSTGIMADHDGQDEKIQMKFNTLEEAMFALEDVEIRLFYALTITITNTNASSQYSAKQKQQLLSYIATRFGEWKEAFDGFSNRVRKDMMSKDLRLSLILGLHYQTTTLMLAVNANSSGSDDNTFRLSQTPSFTKILQLCRTLINTSSSSSSSSSLSSTQQQQGQKQEQKQTFSADMGVIPCLYFTAMNAADIFVRQEAIDLLRGMIGREGFWDPGTVANIAEAVLRLYPQGVEGVYAEEGILVLERVYCGGGASGGVSCC
ncbi:hypothetical protein DL95DRAFT_132875 [Leptodontidium sp. 2 PMI_412]|nr:hypothetical protein DL95DRAFT_132875 [Leptodontidium sp. 2 PMI_412]